MKAVKSPKRHEVHPGGHREVTKEKSYRETAFPIVGTDASAGGLETFAEPPAAPQRLRGGLFERLQADEALRLSEERLRLALAATGQGLYDLDLTTGKAEVNPQYAIMLGYDPATFHETNERWANRLHPEDRERVYPVYQAYIRGEISTYEVEFRQRTKSGEWKWILSIGSIVSRDENGRPLRMLGTHTDITERKRAEEALRASQERLDFLLSSNPAVIYSARCSGDFAATFISANVTAQLGHQPADFTNDAVFWINHIHPEDRHRVLAGLNQFVARGSHTYEHEYRFQHKDGDYRWMHDALRIVPDAAGEPLEIVGYWIDINARKQAEEALRESEEEFRSAFEVSSVGMAQADPFTGRYLRVNRHLCEMTGYSEAELIGRPFTEITHPEDRAVDLEEFSRLVRGDIPELHTEKRYLRKDGGAIWVEITANMVRSVDGQPLRSMAVIQDITERNRLELEKSRAAAFAERNRLARDLHDNLAQGLTGIVLYLEGAEEVLTKSPREAEVRITKARNLARTSLEEARRSLLAMRSSLLDHADLPSAIKNTADNYKPQTSANIELSIQGQPRPLSLKVEENLLRIAQEGLQNAVRHAEASQVRVGLRYEDGSVRLRIEDNGRGFRTKGKRRKYSFGINIMKDRAAEMGGQFHIRSKLGEGTRVEVVVPVLKDSSGLLKISS
jgi:PAS domain S-box-containing protein